MENKYFLDTDILTIKNQNNIKISIVTVVYNGVEFLEETIISVVNQNYNNIEYIIIDGGSNDGTIDIIKKYEDKISYWISEQDNGIYDAMNKGIDLATGEWINFMNAGDSFYNNIVINKLMLFSKDVDIIYGNTNYIYDKNYSRIVNSQIFEQIKFGMPFNHQSCIVKSKLHKKYPFQLKFKIISDYDFFLKIYHLKYNFVKINIIIANFSLGGLSSMITKEQRIERKKIIMQYNNTFLVKLNLYIWESFRVVKYNIKKLSFSIYLIKSYYFFKILFNTNKLK